MTLLLARSLVAVFATISLIHMYWALGGRWATKAVVPQVPVKQGRRCDRRSILRAG